MVNDAVKFQTFNAEPIVIRLFGAGIYKSSRLRVFRYRLKIVARKAARLRPLWPPALLALAWHLATSPSATGEGREAEKLALRAHWISPSIESLDVMTAANAAAGRYARAAAALTPLLESGPESSDSAPAFASASAIGEVERGRLAQRRATYERGERFIDRDALGPIQP